MPVISGTAISGTAVAFFQESDLTRHDIHLAMIFLLIIAVSLAVQAAGIMLAASFASKLFLRVDKIANDVQSRALPLIDKTHTLIAEISPKIQAATTNVEQISYTVREKVDELSATVTQLNETVQGINLRTRAQVSRVDGIVTDALVATEEISATVQQGIRVPIRQISGVIAGLKAGVETLIARSPFGH